MEKYNAQLVAKGYSQVEGIDFGEIFSLVEEKKVLMKVDTLSNVVDSFTKSVSTKKLSWCRESMGIASLDC